MKLLTFQNKCWTHNFVNVINTEIDKILSNKNICNIFLTGGRSAEHFYKIWASTLNTRVDKINFYFGDERCVSSDSKDSNYNLVFKDLFKKNIKSNFNLYRIEAEKEDLQQVIFNYKQILPSKPDIILLSLGEDSHIASLFPYQNNYKNHDDLIITNSNLHNFKRITINYNYINKADLIYCFVIGKKKGIALRKIIEDENDLDCLPGKFILNKATWITDNIAFESLSKNF